MPRAIIRTDSKPLPVTVGTETKHICMCGLSKNYPFCDGTHKITRDEDPNTLYQYDANNQRKEVKLG